jgi:hypothetical protein
MSGQGTQYHKTHTAVLELTVCEAIANLLSQTAVQVLLM